MTTLVMEAPAAARDGLSWARVGIRRAQLQAARCRPDARRGSLCLGRRRQALSRRPVGLFGGEPGPLPPQDHEGDGRPGLPLTLTSRAFRNDQLGLFYEEVCKLTGSHAVSADEHWRRSRRKRDQGLAQVGLRGQRASHPTRPRSSSARTTSTDGPCPWSDSAPTRSPLRISVPSDRGFKVVTVRRLRCAGSGDHPQHRRLSGRADPRRSRRDHPAHRATSSGSATSAPATA